MRFLFVLDRVENAASANALLGRRLCAALTALGHTADVLELTDGETAPPPFECGTLFVLPFADERLMNAALENGRHDAGATPVALRLARLCAHPTAVAAAFRQLVLKKPRRTVACLREIDRLDAENHYDAVCCVCAPYRSAFALEAAHIGGKKLLWQLDPYAANRDYKAPGGYAREGQLLAALDAAFVTPTAVADYAAAGPLAEFCDKVHVVGLPALLPPSGDVAEGAGCVYCGSLYPGLREPDFALRLFAALGDEAPVLTMAGGGWGAFDERMAPLCTALGEKLVRPGLIPPDEADALQNAAGVLLSLGNATDNQLPSKLFGYFATGKPVLHLAVHDSDPALPYLARYPLALVVRQKDDFEGSATKVRGWLREVNGKRLAFEDVAAIYPEFTPEAVAEAFLAGCGGR